MDRSQRATSRIMLTIVFVATVALVVVVAPRILIGYDTSFTLAWGRDLAAGLSLEFTHPSSPTPHPLALAGGLVAGILPASWATTLAGAISVVSVIAIVAALGAIVWQLTVSRLAVTTAALVTLSSAPLGLLVFNASADVTYCAIALAATALTLRRRYVPAIAVFLVASLLRPEAALFAAIPLAQTLLASRSASQDADATRSVAVRCTWVFAIGLALSAGAWLAMGAAGGQPLVALDSAVTNAQLNDDPRGLLTALTSALPGLAGATGWVTVGAAGAALIAAWATRWERARQMSTIAIIITVALIAYLAQGTLGTPLIARYLLFPALLCIALAACGIAMAARIGRPRWASATVSGVVAVGLVAGAVASSIAGWQDVAYARDVRTAAFTDAAELFDTDLARRCDHPTVVRSPAMVAVTALMLGRPLSDITVDDEAGDGVLLQPLTFEAAELAGYGPLTPLNHQAAFPTDAPPRHSTTHWALYSSCQP